MTAVPAGNFCFQCAQIGMNVTEHFEKTKFSANTVLRMKEDQVTKLHKETNKFAIFNDL